MAEHRRIRALLFDKDGTLFDFNATWTGVVEQVISRVAPDEATADALAAAGGFDRQARRFLPGSPIAAGALTEIAEAWAAHLPAMRPGDVVARIAGLSAELTGPTTLVPAAPDLPALLAELSTRGLALGVATHDAEAAAVAQLDAVGARGAFAFLAGYDSGHGLKPGTGMLDAFCATVAVPPVETAVIGDSRHDLGMARAGGALAIGVLTGPATEADLAPHADLILPAITALPAFLDARG